MTPGIVVDGCEVRLDIATVRKEHDVNDGDENCRVCGVAYPCPLLDIAEQLDEWLNATGTRLDHLAGRSSPDSGTLTD